MAVIMVAFVGTILDPEGHVNVLLVDETNFTVCFMLVNVVENGYLDFSVVCIGVIMPISSISCLVDVFVAVVQENGSMEVIVHVYLTLPMAIVGLVKQDRAVDNIVLVDVNLTSNLI